MPKLKAVFCLFALLCSTWMIPGGAIVAQEDPGKEESGQQEPVAGAGVLSDPSGVSPQVQRVLRDMVEDSGFVERLLEDLLETDGQREETRAVMQALESRLAQLQVEREKIQDLQATLGISEGSFDELQKQLQTQRVQLQVDLAGLEARKTALLEQLQAKQPKRIMFDERIREQLMRMEDLARQKLAMTERLHASGTASQAEMMACETDVYNAELQRLEFDREREDEQSPDQSEELMQLALEVAEKSSRLTSVTRLLEEMVPARESIERQSQIEVEQEGLIHQRVARQLDLLQLESRNSRLKREIRLLEEMQGQQEKKAGNNQPPSDKPSADQPSSDKQ